jgi:hypothetical protein
MPVTANKDMVLYQKVCDILISYVGLYKQAVGSVV